MKKDFTIETEISYEQIYNMVHYNMDHFKKYVIYHICFSIVISLVLGAILGLIQKSFLAFVIASVAMIIILLLDFVFYKDRRIAHLVTYSKKMNIKDYYKVHYKFCKDHFVYIDKDENETEIKYSDVDKCVEVDDNFYIIYDGIKIIQKNCCSLEEVTFIRDKFKKVIDNKLRDLDYQVLSNQKSLKRYVKSGNKITTIVLVLTVIALLVNNIYGNYIFLIIFPVLSLIVGLRFRDIRNIFASVVVGSIIVLSFINTNRTNDYYDNSSINNSYKEVLTYNYLFDYKLPESGFALKQVVGKKKNLLNYKEYTITFENENITDMHEHIINNGYWSYDKDRKEYYSYYNKTSNQFNDIRDEGEFEMIELVYSPDIKILSIIEYTTNSKLDE